MARQFKVWWYTNTQTGRIVKFAVADWEGDDSDEDKPTSKNYRPPVAEFPVSMIHSQDVQQERAKKLANYLNDLQKVLDDAVQQNGLIQKITLT